MDNDNSYEVEPNAVTAELAAFLADNATADDVQALAFDIGIDPADLDLSLIHICCTTRCTSLPGPPPSMP